MKKNILRQEISNIVTERLMVEIDAQDAANRVIKSEPKKESDGYDKE